VKGEKMIWKSPKQVLQDFQKGMPKLHKILPGCTDAFTKGLMPDVLKEGILTTKQKELIALGISICSRCDYCVVIHVKSCFDAGASKEEIAEACGVALLMGGGPALTYSTFVAEAIEELAPETASGQRGPWA
jgi:AhpD family alkylhydroperoxidase